jgi:hypothetical protein
MPHQSLLIQTHFEGLQEVEQFSLDR